ncbi:phage terminase large subunit [Candidatus Enterovibrio escicola]|uniref:phage terminase large subunit n=1 Tax=Candidatus Enterovibrio escicola TaxID=1927127 RepID=UPI0021E05777|nr:phage terminase large subunit [Candidatus Enterovibrio escacola]
MKELDAILKPLKGSRIIYLGTQQTEISVYNIIAERGYEVRILPALYPTAKQRDAYVFDSKSRFSPLIKSRAEGAALIGYSTDPSRFTDADLKERRRSYGKGGFALQFMLDTALSDADNYPLKLCDLIVSNIAREKAPTSYDWCNDPVKRITELQVLGLASDHYYHPLF